MNRVKCLAVTILLVWTMVQNSVQCLAADTEQFSECQAVVEIVETTEGNVQVPQARKKTKTVRKTYANRESIEPGIYYEEYIAGHMWGGTLVWTGEYRYIGYGVVEATFTGKLEIID